MDVAEILERIRSIPPGRVAAYSDITPHAPRRAGQVLSASLEPDLPWWRVVHADGSVTKGDRQKELLAAEGVLFGPSGRIDMPRFRATFER